MGSIVIELQKDALDKSTAIADLLRKALVVARKLKLVEFEDWLQGELDGYQNGDKLPEYRRVSGSVKVFNPFHGWQPVHFGDSKSAELLSNRPVGVSAAAIEALLDKHEPGGFLQMPFPSDIERKLMQGIGMDLHPTLILDHSQLVSVLDSIRTIVLKWALKLEEEGILGESLSFTKEEKEAALKPALTINNFFGDISQSQIQQNTANSTQDIEIKGLDGKQIKSVLSALSDLLPNLALQSDDKKELEAEIITVQTQLESPKPKDGIIKQSLSAIQRILEGAAGGAAGQVLIELGKILM